MDRETKATYSERGDEFAVAISVRVEERRERQHKVLLTLSLARTLQRCSGSQQYLERTSVGQLLEELRDEHESALCFGRGWY